MERVGPRWGPSREPPSARRVAAARMRAVSARTAMHHAGESHPAKRQMMTRIEAMIHSATLAAA